MSYKSLKIGKKCKKNAEITNFDPLSLKNYVKKKSEKIQGHSWDCYWAMKVVDEERTYDARTPPVPREHSFGVHSGGACSEPLDPSL